jgi:tetratricopeptide (TPR) repeat protein
MKKIIGFLAVVLAAYLTAFYTKGKQNGYEKPFDFSILDSLFSNKSNISDHKDDDIIEAEKLLSEQNYNQALSIFLEKLDDDNNAANNYLVGHTYLLMDDYDNAVYYCGNAINLDFNHALAYLDRGKAYYNKGFYSDAINDLYFNTELTPENPESYYYLGLCYEKQGQNEPALQSVITAIKFDSLNTDYFFRAGFIAYDLEKYSESADFYKRLLKIDSTHKFSLVNLGLTYSNMNNPDSAFIMYDRAIQLYPDYALAYNNKAYLFQTAKKYDQAIKLYSTAVQLDPSDTRQLWNRAECYKMTKDYQKAITDYKKVYELNNSYYNVLYSIGECFELLNDKKSALEYYINYKSHASNESEFYDQVDKKIKLLNNNKEPK